MCLNLVKKSTELNSTRGTRPGIVQIGTALQQLRGNGVVLGPEGQIKGRLPLGVSETKVDPFHVDGVTAG